MKKRKISSEENKEVDEISLKRLENELYILKNLVCVQYNFKKITMSCGEIPYKDIVIDGVKIVDYGVEIDTERWLSKSE